MSALKKVESESLGSGKELLCAMVRFGLELGDIYRRTGVSGGGGGGQFTLCEVQSLFQYSLWRHAAQFTGCLQTNPATSVLLGNRFCCLKHCGNHVYHPVEHS
jgi:hypothetical protein